MLCACVRDMADAAFVVVSLVVVSLGDEGCVGGPLAKGDMLWCGVELLRQLCGGRWSDVRCGGDGYTVLVSAVSAGMMCVEVAVEVLLLVSLIVVVCRGY